MPIWHCQLLGEGPAFIIWGRIMPNVATCLLFLFALALGVGAAEAGGWSGGDSSSLRGNFKQGHTLKWVYDHLDGR